MNTRMLLGVVALVALAGGALLLGRTVPVRPILAAEEHETAAHPDHDAAHGEDAHAGHGHEASGAHEAHAEPEGGHEDHDGHAHPEDEHDAHDGEEGGLALSTQQRQRFGVVVKAAGPGSLRNEVSLPGEIVFNEDRLVHLVPRVAGIVREVTKTIGDVVKPGELLAVIDSRELAETKAEYLAAHERLRLAQANYKREEGLWREKISAEQDYIEAKQVLAEMQIALNSAEQKLHALGFSHDYLQDLLTHPEASFTRYEIRAPFGGAIIDKHITLGEALKDDAGAFTIADTGSVWVNLTVHAKDLPAVHPGQEVVLRADHSDAQAKGAVKMITPFVDVATRAATARVILDNSDGRWRPGTFVTGFISTSEKNLPVVVPRNAVQNIEGREVVFIEREGRFEMTPVTLGRVDRTHAEVVSGLKPGTPYVAEGAFQLKATAVTSTLGSHAGHGH